jgi:hypothetical protein|nr:MAG TPA: tail component [Caudoviricetes sp.]
MSLLIGKHIKETLCSNSDIVAAVGKRIYPLVIPEGTPRYPFIVYRNLGVQPDYTKDGNNQDSVQVQVTVVAKGYEESVSIANTVRYAFDGKGGSYPDFTVNECEVDSSGEEYIQDVDAYAVNLIFNFKTNDL